jgi:UDP-glucose 4-epimerase
MKRVLVTGACGAVGQVLIQELAAAGVETLATDIRRHEDMPDGVGFMKLDVRGSDAKRIVKDFKPDVIVHLASIVSPTRGMTREFAHDVDVKGTRNVLDAAISHGVKRLVVTSSGAAYGYHADNPVPLSESDPVRGNPEFAYSDHKRQVEEMLAEARASHPGLEQVVLRVGTVLGAGLENQITELFHRPKLIAVRGSDSPFVFIWTRDLARILMRAAGEGPAGIFNVCGDGALSVHDLARVLGKPVMALPAWVLKAALGDCQTTGPFALRAGTGAFSAIPPGARQHGAEDRVRVHAGTQQRADIRAVAQGGGPVSRVAVITGGAGGLGKALAHRLLKEDWRVVLMDLPAALQALKLESEGVERVACDLTDEAAVASTCAEISARHPAVDLVIHNAGVTQIGLFDETTLASQRLVMEINYFGSVRVAAGLLKAVRKGRGTHLAVSSVAGFAPLYKRTAYAASKHALNGFFASLASEEAQHGVKVVIAAPSFVRQIRDDLTRERTASAGRGLRRTGLTR